MARAAAPSPPASAAKRRRRSLARTGSTRARTIFAQQSVAAIAAGAFHNDVVAVANERVLFAHELAFEDKAALYADIARAAPWAEIVEVPADRVSLADAIASYLFNAQLVTLPDGTMALIVPGEARDNAAVWAWLQEMIAGNGPIRRVEVVDVRQSMANGGGPACLRLRVVARSDDGRSALPGRRRQARPHRRGDRGALARGNRDRRDRRSGADRSHPRRPRRRCSKSSKSSN